MINYLLSQNWVLYWLPLSVAFTVIYRYYTRNFNYFTKMGVNGPKPVIIFGNLWELLFTSKDKLDIKRVRKYGKLFGIFDGNKPLLQIADPVLIKQILVKDFHMFTDRPLISNASHPIANQMVAMATRG
ncbi:unnamed protein product [Medioppia subpectinata]|uniref:Cytochrome P450 n=1 Tax=Medioppia subpectinata TaxID=1979941 RepID=A0A7R9Q1C8_9ACAR|nr:unnamed protein product [Medioppia subpectinata]CAG2108956.1 unnamed protein product [Medioppia subpectinata]